MEGDKVTERVKRLEVEFRSCSECPFLTSAKVCAAPKGAPATPRLVAKAIELGGFPTTCPLLPANRDDG